MLPGGRKSESGPQPAHYSAGELTWKDSGCVPVSRATAQTVWRRTGQCPGLLHIKFPCYVYWEGSGHRKKKKGRLDVTFLKPQNISVPLTLPRNEVYKKIMGLNFHLCHSYSAGDLRMRAPPPPENLAL